MNDQIKQIIDKAIAQQNLLLASPIDLSLGLNSPLYGKTGQVDSLTLVSMLVDIEASLNDVFSTDVRLADTSDLAPTETPFSTLGALMQYIERRLGLEVA